MNTKLSTALVSGAIVLLSLTGCVSSRKYKASQAELAKARNDSAQLAQQVTALNGNVHDLNDRNSALQRSLDSSSTQYAAQQKSLDYYHTYFKAQQDTLSRISDDIKSALTQAGISNGDVQMVNNTVYVRLDEDELFRKNSLMVTPGGKKALDTLAQVISSRSNVNVFVGGGDSAGTGASYGNMSAMNNTAGASSGWSDNPRPKHHRTHAAASATTTATASTTTSTSSTPVHKKVHHHYSAEGSMAFSDGSGHHNRAWALKQVRMVKVANHFLQNGVSKVNVSLQKPAMNGTPDKTIRIIITPKMDDFNPQSYSATSANR